MYTLDINQTNQIYGGLLMSHLEDGRYLLNLKENQDFFYKINSENNVMFFSDGIVLVNGEYIPYAFPSMLSATEGCTYVLPENFFS